METLTNRERQVVDALCQGLSNKGIARVLDIAEGTVKLHLHSVFTKLGVAGRLPLIVLLKDLTQGEK